MGFQVEVKKTSKHGRNFRGMFLQSTMRLAILIARKELIRRAIGLVRDALGGEEMVEPSNVELEDKRYPRKSCSVIGKSAIVSSEGKSEG